jgi:hypothetical protein
VASAKDPRVDALRERLRALGYLDAGVDRFVLGAARHERSDAAIAAAASARIGLLAAVLLGPAAAVGIGWRLPALVTSVRDALVVALYLGVLFGLAAAAGSFAAAYLARLATRGARGPRFARRGRLASVAAGALVALLCLTYLTLWWGAASAGFGWSAPLRTAFALAVAVAISLLLGHAVTLTSLALVARDEAGALLQPRVPGASWKISLPLAAAAFGGASALLIAAAPAETDAPQASPFAIVPTGLTVTVVGIDGFDLSLYEELAAAGRVPRLASILGGARAAIAGVGDRDPARVWTTLATGQPAAQHGVAGLETRRVTGLQGTMPAGAGPVSPAWTAVAAATDLLRLTRPAIASGTERREKTVWEIAAEKGLRTAVVNWWASWPATDTDGIVISDRAALRLEHGGVPDGEIAPAALYDRLTAAWPALRASAEAQARQAFGDDVSALDDRMRAVLRRSAELDAVHVAIALGPELAGRDLLMLYLPGLDIAQHALLAGGGEGALAPSVAAAHVEGLRRYYVFLDGLIDPIVEAGANRGAPAQLVFLLAQPGRVVQNRDGVLAAAGPGAGGGARLAAAPEDVAPTLLYALGAPASRELPGRPLLGLFADVFVRKYPVREVASYGGRRVPTARRPGEPLDREMIERLRSLGYVR